MKDILEPALPKGTVFVSEDAEDAGFRQIVIHDEWLKENFDFLYTQTSHETRILFQYSPENKLNKAVKYRINHILNNFKRALEQEYLVHPAHRLKQLTGTHNVIIHPLEAINDPKQWLTQMTLGEQFKTAYRESNKVNWIFSGMNILAFLSNMTMLSWQTSVGMVLFKMAFGLINLVCAAVCFYMPLFVRFPSVYQEIKFANRAKKEQATM